MQTSDRRRGIERKILSSILKVGILPLLIALIVGYYAAHRGLSNLVLGSLENAASNKVLGVARESETRIGMARKVSNHPDVIDALTPENGRPAALASEEKRELLVDAISREVEGVGQDSSVINVYDATGRLVATTDASFKADARISEWIGRLDIPRYIDVDLVPGRRYYAALLVTPVFGAEENKVIGYLAEWFNVQNMLMYALTDPMPTTGEVDMYQAVYSGKLGFMAARVEMGAPPGIPPLVISPADPQLSEILKNAPSAPGRTTINDYAHHVEGEVLQEDRFIAFAPLFKQFDLWLVVSRPAAAVYRTIYIGAVLALAGSIVIIAFLVLNAYRNVHNNIVRPVMLLNEGAQIIGHGDLELKLKIGTGDEIEELATSFNKMALALKRNIRQLEESEAKYRNLVTSMRDGIFQTSPEGVISFLNPAGVEIFGYRGVDEIIGLNLRGLFLDTEEMTRIFVELQEKEFLERSRVWMKRQDGRAICVELSGNVVYDDSGKVTGVEGIFRDVTKSVRLEQEARDRAERLSAINQIANVINSSLEAGRLYENLVVEVKKLVAFDYAELALLSDRGEAFHVRQLWPEPAAEGVVTYPADDETYCSAWVARRRECLIIDDMSSEECELAVHFPRSIRSSISVPLYASGRIIGTLNLGAEAAEAFSKHDVEVLDQIAPHLAVAIRNAQLLENLQSSLEEVTRAREDLHKANEELKTLDEMKTNLLSNVSHELRTPLVSVMGYTDMIYNEKVGPVTETQREYLGISLRNVEKLVTLIENLLDFSRLHRGTERLVFSKMDLVDCAKTSIDIIRPVANSRNIALVLEAPAEVQVEGDKGKLGQVFNNLLSNAVKFIHNEGTVTVSITPKEDHVEVRVIDTGIGIPREAQDKVFTRFYQYDSSSTRKYGGTGIGLSIAQDIVRMHGGRITVSSEEGKGSTFLFSLPQHAAAPEPEPEPTEPESLETRLLVELLSRDRSLSNELRNQLAPEGMDIMTAVSGAHAIALAQKHRPDCVVIDADSDADGRQALEALLTDVKTRELPVILLTNDDELYAAYRDRVAARIKAGFRKSSVLSAIQRAAGRDTRQQAPRAQGGNRVLCVDDDPEILTFMHRCLEREGYEVEGCGTGEEAVERAASQAYGLVLLDIAMPGLDGWETCRRIKQEICGPETKVYMVTAKPVESLTHRIDETGADGYLMKPFRPEDLLDLVRGALNVHATKES